MPYAAMSTETLTQIEQNARAAIEQGGSAAVMRARYGVLGAVSAVLATR
jgi:hypothetical protein